MVVSSKGKDMLCMVFKNLSAIVFFVRIAAKTFKLLCFSEFSTNPEFILKSNLNLCNTSVVTTLCHPPSNCR